MKRIFQSILSFAIFIVLLSNMAIAQSNGNGNGNGNGNANGIGNGNGQGLQNNPNYYDPPAPGDTDNPVLDAIPIDNGLVFLLAAGTILGAVMLGKGRKTKTVVN